MLDLAVVEGELIAAKPYFKKLSPGPAMLFRGKLSEVYWAGNRIIKAAQAFQAGVDPATIIGEAVGARITKRMARPFKTRVTTVHKHIQQVNHDPLRKNGMGGRTWLPYTGRQKMVIVFHDANRAGPHVDVHIGRLSLVYRVKPDLYSQLKYNRDGALTESSRKAILDYVRAEVQEGARVPQNLDHSVSNARASWVGGDPNAKTYGSGRTRQIVSETEVEIYKAEKDGPIELYAPLLNPHRGLYLYRLYPGDSKRAPICIFGARKNQPPVLEDRLHLKMIDPRKLEEVYENAEDTANKLDLGSATAKYDGASGYVVITPKGTTVWSPRQSVKTGEQIEYTHKLDGIARIKSDKTIVAMGEIMFHEKAKYPWQQGRLLSAAEIGGVLNSNSVLPRQLRPEIRLYRVDRMGTERTRDHSFWNNRVLQQQVAALDPARLKVVEFMDPDEAKAKGFEGVVLAPLGKSVNDGTKVKWWSDPHDWRIDSVEFEPGERGGIAGVIRCTSLESGKSFKLGPGQVGNRSLTERMMNDPTSYIGTVIKVNSRHGHEGRAAKVLGFHSDKGFAPVE